MTGNNEKMVDPPKKQEKKSTSSENPMKNIKTKPLPTQMMFYSKHGKNRENGSSSSK